MSINDFIAIVRDAAVLSQQRKQQLIDNAQWTTEEERRQLVQTFTDAELRLKELDQGKSDQLETFADALQEFQQSEMPGILREAEEKGKQAEKAEDVLQEWDDEQ